MLTRAERRRQENKKPAARYNLSMEDIQAYVTKEVDNIRHNTVASMAAVFLVTLHDEFGFGSVRLQRLLERFNNTFDCINSDPDLNFDDFYKVCLEDYGIDIKRRNQDGN